MNKNKTITTVQSAKLEGEREQKKQKYKKKIYEMNKYVIINEIYEKHVHPCLYVPKLNNRWNYYLYFFF